MDALVDAEKQHKVASARAKSLRERAMQGICNALESASDVSVRVASPISFVLLFGIVIVLLMEIIFRRVPILDVTWTEELAKMLSVALASISASIAFRKGLHIGVTYLLMKIKSTKILSLLNITVQLFISAFLFVAIYYGFLYAAAVYGQTAPSVRVSMFWPHLSIPIGSMMMLVHSLYFLSQNVKTLLRTANNE